MSARSKETRQLQRRQDAAQAEQIVADWLTSRGYQIVARNLRLSYLELDIVARLGPLVVVVEVRHRRPGSFTTAFSSINSEKRRRIRYAAERLWARRYAKDASVERLRIDAASVCLVGPEIRLEYCVGAF